MKAQRLQGGGAGTLISERGRGFRPIRNLVSVNHKDFLQNTDLMTSIAGYFSPSEEEEFNYVYIADTVKSYDDSKGLKFIAGKAFPTAQREILTTLETLSSIAKKKKQPLSPTVVKPPN